MSGQQPSSLPSAGGPPTTGLSAAQQHQRPPGGPSALEQEIARLQKQLSDEQRARDEAAKELRTQLSNVSQQLAQQQEENFNLQLALTTTDTENNHMQKELEQVKKQLSFKEAEVKEADRLRAR